jgi:hypothetical protein
MLEALFMAFEQPVFGLRVWRKSQTVITLRTHMLNVKHHPAIVRKIQRKPSEMQNSTGPALEILGAALSIA